MLFFLRPIHAWLLLTCVLCACSENKAEGPRDAPAAQPAPAAANAAPSAAAKTVPGPAARAPGLITIDGSSTVYLVNEAVAEEFQKKNAVKVTIGVSGTGGGFKKLCAGEIAIAGASRPIKPLEAHACASQNIDFIELPIAYDGMAIVVNPKNTWATSITTQELKKLWEPAAQRRVTTWHDVRPSWPDEEVHLFGPGPDSGTYDYFTKAIVGEEHASRGDFTPSEDDNVLVRGVAGDPLALGYFGLAYYVENAKELKLVPVDDGIDSDGKGPIPASADNVRNGTYQPLSRPLFIYVNKADADRPEVSAFVEYYLKHGSELVAEARYVPLPPKAYGLAQERFKKRTTGSLFLIAGGSQVGVTVESLLARQQ
jgi:phosphate transport system substrate-binding protein